MAVLPLRWQSRSRLERVRAEVEGRCESWLGEWSAGARDRSVQVADAADEGACAPASEQWQELRAGDACLRLRLPANAFAEWGRRLLDTREHEAAGLAEGIGRRAFAALAQGLLGVQGEMPVAIERPASAELASRHGVAALQALVAGVRIGLYFDARACDRLAPLPAPAAVALIPRSAAIGAGEIALVATLDLGYSPLEQALSLRPGEIIKTGLRLDAPVRLRTPSGEPVLDATLIQRDGARALRVVAPFRQQT